MKSVQVGQWVRVYWDDVGARDGIIIEKDKKEIKIFQPLEKNIDWIEKNRILSTGPIIRETPRF